ncbi:hypothetical protein [Altericista sp. CCNU0014]
MNIVLMTHERIVTEATRWSGLDGSLTLKVVFLPIGLSTAL